MSILPTSSGAHQRTGASAAAQSAGATPSQLDIIAEVNERAARQLWGRRARRMAALVGGALLLVAALWWFLRSGAALAPAPLRPADAVPAEDLRDTPATVAQDRSADPVAGPTSPDAVAAPAQGALAAPAPTRAPAAPGTEAAAEKRAGKARTDAMQLQQERLQAETQERQLREAEREAQYAREQAEAASRRAAEQAPAPAPSAAEPRPDVRELCAASSNIFSKNFCHARECRKPEHANDAICARLREIEQSRPPGSQ